MEPTKPKLISSFLGVHAIVSRGLDVANENLSRYPERDPAMLGGFLNYVRALSSIIHGHHLTEDQLAFPYFRKMMPEAPFELLSEQHRQLEPLLDTMNAAIQKCEDRGNITEDFRRLAQALERMKEGWYPHIRIEEEHFTYARIESLRISDEEQSRLVQQFGEHSRQHTGPPYLVMPFLLYNTPLERRAQVAETLPPEVTQHLIPVVWKDKWANMKPFLLD